MDEKLKPDPWKHRAIGMRCHSCMWFVVKAQQPDTPQPPSNSANGSLGRCRRHAPSATGFVPVFERDWCGDHRLDENKV